MTERYYATLPKLGRVEVGEMLPTERGLVLNNWTQQLTEHQGHGQRSGSKHRHVYLTSNGQHTERLAESSTVLVARDAECAALAYGWIAAGIVHGQLALHWACTKSAYRRMGVARLLFDAMEQHQGELKHFTHHSYHDAIAKRFGLTYLSPQRKSA